MRLEDIYIKYKSVKYVGDAEGHGRCLAADCVAKWCQALIEKRTDIDTCRKRLSENISINLKGTRRKGVTGFEYVSALSEIRVLSQALIDLWNYDY